MMKFEDPGSGTVYEARSAAGIVRQMSASKLATSASRRTYREGVASRLAATMDLHVDASSDKVFLSSLVEAGVLNERG